jgi:uncharacterized protein YndB with AHSA1/START domain
MSPASSPTSPSVRTTADAALGVVRAVLETAASPERVWRALTDPRELEAWWGSSEMYQTYDWQTDLRPGGERSCKARAPGHQEISVVKGEYLAVDPPRLLEFTWRPSWDGYVETRVRIELDPVPGGTRVTVVHTGFADAAKSVESHRDGWERVLGWAGAFLAR